MELLDNSAHTEPRTDLRGHGLVAVFLETSDKGDRITVYVGRRLSKAERNYSITERKHLAVVVGRDFKTVTGHHALRWISTSKDPAGRLGRWALRIKKYKFTVVYKSGKLHREIDCLSGYPVGPRESGTDDAEFSPLPIFDTTDMLHNSAVIFNCEKLSTCLALMEPHLHFLSSMLGTMCPTTTFAATASPWLLVIVEHLGLVLFKNSTTLRLLDTWVLNELIWG